MPVAPCGIQSLPRELELPEDGVLRIKPLRELQSLRYDEKQEEAITVKSDTAHRLKEIGGNTIELEVTFKSPAAKEFGLDVLCDKNGENGLRVAVLPESKTLRVGKVNAPFELKEGEDLTLRVFIDKNLVEVFANDRQAAVAARQVCSGKSRRPLVQQRRRRRGEADQVLEDEIDLYGIPSASRRSWTASR